MSYWNHYPPYVSVSEKKAKAKRLIKKLTKKGVPLEPIELEGIKLAQNWWGKAWNKNLEGYADYSNRIGRGRSYVRNGMVLDLKIKQGTIDALVAGSRSKPYSISVKIDTLPSKTWKTIISKTEGMIDSVHSLLEGKFPKEFKDFFQELGSGLFPSSKQIHFSCSCPDSAYMCKHVAATLYGIGSRLDINPELFFILRGVKMEDLAGKVVKKTTQKLLKAARKQSKKSLSMEKSELSDLFGIAMDENPEISAIGKKRTEQSKTIITIVTNEKKKKGTKKSTVSKKVATIKKTFKKKPATSKKTASIQKITVKKKTTNSKKKTAKKSGIHGTTKKRDTRTKG